MDPVIPAYLDLEFGEYPARVLKHALHYADKEWPVVPLHTLRPTTNICTCRQGADCQSCAKHPVPINGVKAATTNVTVIQQWWHTHPTANIGIATGHGLLVVDIDPRHGGSLDALSKRFALPETAMVRTGSSGWHLYFAYSGDLKNSAGKLGEGIDTRGHNGYVVAPPSLHATGNYYAWANQLAPTPLPPSLLDALSSPTKSKLYPSTQPTLLTQKTDTSLPGAGVTNATQLLPLAKAAAIPEGKRNSALLSIAGALRNQGATTEAIGEALKVINLIQCSPPLSDAEVKRIADSADRWVAGTVAQQGIVPETLTMGRFISVALSLPNLEWAIPTFLPVGVTLLAGKPKMGKSWLALALALAIAEDGLALGTLPVTQGQVLYLGLEDSLRRIADRSVRLLQGRVPPENFIWSGAWNQLNAGGLADIEDWLYKHKEARLVVIDTLAKVRPMTTSNSSGYSDDYAIMTPLKAIAEDNNVAILVIHHLRKMGAPDVMDTISGTTGLTGATDCNMVLDRERGKDNAILHITGRDIEEQVLHLKFDTETTQWMLQSAKTSSHLTRDHRKLIEVLERADGPLSPKKLSESLTIKPSYARKLVHELVSMGKIRSVRRGAYEVSPLEDEEGSLSEDEEGEVTL